MNFTQLVQRMIAECGVSGTLTTVVGQVGSLGRCVNWVSQAWLEIQTEHDDWEFMRSSRLLGLGASFTTVSGQLFYPLGTGAGTVGVAAADFGHWEMGSFRCQVTSVGIQSETYMDCIGFDNWRNSYMYGAMQTVITRPVAIAEGPQNQLCIGPASNGQYTITGDFFWGPQVLTLDADEPKNLGNTWTLPVRFQMLIVYRAMRYYAAYESAPEVHQRAVDGEGELLAKLEMLYLPQFLSGEPLA
jgi:hypothetical protein